MRSRSVTAYSFFADYQLFLMNWSQFATSLLEDSDI